MFWPTGSFRYERHTPETTLLYQLVERHWPEFKAVLSAQGKQLPGYVAREFDDYLKCGRLEHGFLRVRCDTCHHEKSQTGAITLIQRFGSALNLNPHFHMLYLNGVYDTKGYFWPVKPPTCEGLDVIGHTIARRVSRFLEKAGYLSAMQSPSTWI